MSTIPPCMDRYLNRYIIAPPPPHPTGYYHSHSGQNQNQSNSHPGPLPPPQSTSQQQQQISSQQQSNGNHPHNYMLGCYPNANGWAGVPLISTACRRPRKYNHHNNNNNNINNNNQNGNHTMRSMTSNSNDFDENAMSRLAKHAQGAPLILTGRYKNKSYVNNNNNNNNIKKENIIQLKQNNVNPKDDFLTPRSINNSTCYNVTQNNNNNNNNFCPNNNQINNNQQHKNINSNNNISIADTISITSDESTGSSVNNCPQETCLPRIIKPRKRRKKDRKPITNTIQMDVQNQSIVNQEQPMILPSQQQLQMSQQQSQQYHHIHHQPSSQYNDNIMERQMVKNENVIETMTTAPLATLSTITSGIDEMPFITADVCGVEDINNNESSATSSTVTLNSLSGTSSCSCRLCDPFCKIWAFPLRRSCSDNTAELEMSRIKDVGVIGSNRLITVRNEWRSTAHNSLDGGIDYNGSRKGSFSDSGDSGCDLLSGLNFSDDIFPSSSSSSSAISTTSSGINTNNICNINNNNFNNISNISSAGNCSNSSSNNSIIINNNNNNINIGNNYCNNTSSSHTQDYNSELMNINCNNNNDKNECVNNLTKKIAESLDLRSGSDCLSSDSGSVLSDSVFSDSVPDLFINFDSISRNNLFSVNNISNLKNFLFVDDHLTAPALVSNNIIINNSSNSNNNNNKSINNNNNNGNHMIQNNNNTISNFNTNNLSLNHNNNSIYNIDQMNQQQNNFNLFNDIYNGNNGDGLVGIVGNHICNNGGAMEQSPFKFIPDKDCCSEILNCFDMVWNRSKLLPVEEL